VLMRLKDEMFLKVWKSMKLRMNEKDEKSMKLLKIEMGG